ncbi:PQQ-binding-like beta-propeller repeat protein [Saccharibacter sp. 17.LH.SD]|uniref:PQQ-binding-like beta-propeller repeat protein n=1 Tax=Saccharibacter sp. 17.LH.SD TaxID=2689393 RepID=UPI00136D6EA9|nr:PQQ-binding-like beta-propeller repeat protein [Saccharibacter sp. 17.LH.SD]MXV44539.1 PQQ-binding-like beta-propeller repeat protein [Saccharibacter sp. 17.LH.SD]
MIRRFLASEPKRKGAKGMPRREALKAACASGALLALGGCDLFSDDGRKQALPGRRIDVLSTGAGLSTDSHNKLSVSLPSVQNVTEWCFDGRVPSHEAVNARWSGGTKQLWHHSIGAEVDPVSYIAMIAMVPNRRGALQSPPVIGNQRIFTTDAQGHVRAWSWPQLDLLWHYQPAKHTRSTNIGGGTALVGDTLYIVDGVAQALAVDAATGRRKWAVDLVTPGRSAPTIKNGLMVFSTIDERLYALDTATGHQVWTYQATEVSTGIFGQATSAIVDGIVLAGFGSGDLVALRATSGEVVWSDSLGGGNGMGAMLDFACVRGAPVIADGTAYAVSMSQVLVAIDMRSGRRLWEREASSQNSLCVCGDWLYVISLDQQLACLDRLSGQVAWVTQLRRFEHEDSQKGSVQWVGPLLVNNRIVCFSSLPKEGMVVVNAMTGRVEAQTAIQASCQVPPIVCDGQVLALTQDGVLRAYG